VRDRPAHRRKDSTYPLSGLVGRANSEARRLLAGPIVRNAASLYGSTVATSVLGFFYWFVAARMASASAVGVASAIQSSAQFLAIFCVLGLSTLMISELALDRSRARSLILTAAVSAAGFAVVVAVAGGLVLGVYSPTLREGLSIPVGLTVFALLSAFTTTLIILDDSCVGLFRADLQFRRNAVFAVGKLMVLPLMIVLWPSHAGTELVVAWTVGLVISLVTVGIAIANLTRGEPTRLVFGQLIEKRRLMAGHHSLNISIQSPRLLIPVVVVTVIGAKENAAYTAAMLVVAFVNIIPQHLSTVLFALTPGDEVSLHREVKKTMRICLILALLSAPFFAIFGHLILSVFGPAYVVASGALAVLGLTTYPMAIKAHYVAISRSRGRMQQAASRSMIGAILEVGLAALGARLYGVTGVALGFLLAVVLEAFLFAPVVFGVLRSEPPLPTGVSDMGAIPSEGVDGSDEPDATGAAPAVDEPEVTEAPASDDDR
jgi:O-antigen/teichoic acid export membrane protein